MTLCVLAVSLAATPAVVPLAAWENLLGEPDWTSLGLILAIVGSFLLANGILFRHPRTLVEQRFGKDQPLRTIREFIFHRVQMTLGFAFLLSGFALQLFARTRFVQAPAAAEGGSTALWIGAIVVLAIALEAAGWWWSVHSFRRYVGAWLREHPPAFETDTNLAREIGELFGIPPQDGDTVQSYAQRLRQAIGLLPQRTSAPPRPRRTPVLEFDEPEPVEEEI